MNFCHKDINSPTEIMHFKKIQFFAKYVFSTENRHENLYCLTNLRYLDAYCRRKHRFFKTWKNGVTLLRHTNFPKKGLKNQKMRKKLIFSILFSKTEARTRSLENVKQWFSREKKNSTPKCSWASIKRQNTHFLCRLIGDS